MNNEQIYQEINRIFSQIQQRAAKFLLKKVV